MKKKDYIIETLPSKKKYSVPPPPRGNNRQGLRLLDLVPRRRIFWLFGQLLQSFNMGGHQIAIRIADNNRKNNNNK